MNIETLVKVLPVNDLVVLVYQDKVILTYPVTEFVKDPVTNFKTLPIEGKVVDAMYANELIFLLTEGVVKVFEVDFYDDRLPEIKLREIIKVENSDNLKFVSILKGRSELVVYGENEFHYTAFVIDLVTLEQKSFKTKEQAVNIFIEEDKYVIFNHDSTVEIYNFDWELLECMDSYMRGRDVTKAIKTGNNYVLSVNSFNAEDNNDLFIIDKNILIDEILELNNTLDSDGNPTISSLDELEELDDSEVFFDDRVTNIVDISFFQDRLLCAQHRDNFLYVFEVSKCEFTLIKTVEFNKGSKVSAHLHGNALLSITFEEGKETLELQSL